MKKYIVMDSEYCSMGRWISVIVGKKLGMKLYEGKDLVKLADEEWLTEEYLKDSITTNMNETVSEIKSKEINQNIWSYVEVTSPDKVTFYYACIYNNRIYEVTYKIYSDGSSLCSKAHDELINSLIFSKNSGSINRV